jgi:hypothetical protein
MDKAIAGSLANMLLKAFKRRRTLLELSVHKTVCIIYDRLEMM